MKLRLLLIGLVASLLAGCWVQEAPESHYNELSIVSDKLTKDDSLIIQRFAKEYKITVRYEQLSPDAILHRIRTQKYNADIDIIFTEDDELRNELMQMKKLRPLANEHYFGKLDRQFNNRHHLWLPITHDPLILSRNKDTLHSCPAIDFGTWHLKDSAYPKLTLRAGRKTQIYRNQLDDSRYKWLSHPPKHGTYSTEKVYALSDYVQRHYLSDSMVQREECLYYLAYKKRTFSTISSLSVFRYGRNVAVAERFIAFCAANAYHLASGRNQLPVNRHITANWYIRSLSIR